jgi:hypothetical protein
MVHRDNAIFEWSCCLRIGRAGNGASKRQSAFTLEGQRLQLALVQRLPWLLLGQVFDRLSAQLDVRAAAARTPRRLRMRVGHGESARRLSLPAKLENSEFWPAALNKKTLVMTRTTFNGSSPRDSPTVAPTPPNRRVSPGGPNNRPRSSVARLLPDPSRSRR